MIKNQWVQGWPCLMLTGRAYTIKLHKLDSKERDAEA